MPKEALITSRDPKGRHVTSLFEAAFNAERFDGEEGQRIAERGAEFKAKAQKLLRDIATPNRYKKEEGYSGLTYPNGYILLPLVEQIKQLEKLFPGIETARALRYVEEKVPALLISKYAEGWFAFPRWQELERTYDRAVMRVVKKLAGKTGFFSYCVDDETLTPKTIHESSRTSSRLERLAQAQGFGDILLMPAQFGHRRVCMSPRRARELYQADEFGLGSFAVGCMALVHPKRLTCGDHQTYLGLMCPGDEVDSEGKGEFTCATHLSWKHQLGFDIPSDENWEACRFDGAATAFLPH